MTFSYNFNRLSAITLSINFIALEFIEKALSEEHVAQLMKKHPSVEEHAHSNAELTRKVLKLIQADTKHHNLTLNLE